MDSDEDVIFENSALHKHLQYMGVENIETEAHPEQKSVKPGEKFPEQDPFCLPGVAGKGKQLISDCLCFLHFRTLLRKSETSSKNKIYEKLRQSKTLEPDDSDFLEEFLGPVVAVESRTSKLFFGFLAVIIVMVAILAQRILSASRSRQHVFFSDPVSILATCCLILLVGCSVFLHLKQKKLEEQVLIFADFLKKLEIFQVTLKKSIRLIQESELVAKGFTLVNNTASLSGMEQGAFRKSARECPELRHRVFHAARDSMLSIRKSSQILLQKFYPLSPGEITSHYLAFIPLEDYGPCIKIVGKSLESQAQLLEATDNFSIASLKAISNLWTLQQSEFVRCLAVCFQSLSSWPSNKSQTVSIQRILHQVVHDPLSTLSDSSKALKHCFDFHYASSVERDERKPVVFNSEDMSLKGLYVAVHSLDLHLQSALKTCRNLASELERSLENSKGDASRIESGNDWMHSLQRVHAELAACQDCWAEGQAQGERLFKIQVASPVEKDGPVGPVCTPAQTKPVIEIIGDPVIKDEVFEAYVDEEDIDVESSSWDEFLTPEEKAKKKKEKEEALRLLSELKTVISGLAVERKKKEDGILKAKLGVSDVDYGSDNHEEETNNDNGVVHGSVLEPQNKDYSVSVSLKGTGIESMKKEERGLPMVTKEEESEQAMADVSEPSTSTSREANSSEGLGVFENSKKDEKKKPPSPVPSEINPNDSQAETNVFGKLEVADRLECLSGANLPFASFIAAQAVAKSRLLGLKAETFGDSDEDVETDSDRAEGDV